MAFLGAGGVKLIDQLRDPLAEINKKRQAGLQGTLGRIGTRQIADSRASGRVYGEYAPQQLQIAGNQASRGIEGALLEALGGVSFDEQRKQQEHEASLALAQEIGDEMSPSVLEQILGGLSSGARAGGQFYGLYKQLGKSPGLEYGGGSGRLPSKLSLIPGGSATAYYGGR